jgi:acyl-CoA synthetase (AMP-forming)/AMP-acid ligase II
MFSMICNRDRTMGCCKVKTGLQPHRGWWQGTSGCVGSGALLVLLPKCPMCIAAYLALWTGASVAMPIATYVRPVTALLFLASVSLLGLRWAAVRLRARDR